MPILVSKKTKQNLRPVHDLRSAGLVAIAGTQTPDPIPNSEVKRPSANGTASQDVGESVAARPAKRKKNLYENILND